jgi:hypothetical protein
MELLHPDNISADTEGFLMAVLEDRLVKGPLQELGNDIGRAISKI